MMKTTILMIKNPYRACSSCGFETTYDICNSCWDKERDILKKNIIKRVTLTCEHCGFIGKFEGTEEVLDYAIHAIREEHWEDFHPYPNIEYNWSKSNIKE